MATTLSVGTPTVVVSTPAMSGVVREVDEPLGLVLLQLKGGDTAWAFASDCARRTAAQPPPPRAASTRSPPSDVPDGLDAGADPGLAVGTLRWAAAHVFPRLGPPSLSAAPAAPLERLTSFGAYVNARLPPAARAALSESALGSIYDGLSFPLSFLYAWKQLKASAPSALPAPAAELTIVLMGASRRVEERLLFDSDYWLELVHAAPGWLPESTRIKLLFAGREVLRHGEEVQLHPRLRCCCFRGDVCEALDAHGCTAASAVLVGFNTGCGSGIEPVMLGWAPDLVRVLDAGYLAIFTCANDYSDLRGELGLHDLLGAAHVLKPTRNPFPCAVVMLGEETTRGKLREWSRGNSFLYAVKGVHEASAERVRAARTAKSLHDDVRALAKYLLESQTPSEPP